MQTVDFSPGHVEATMRLAKQNYEEERASVPTLPSLDSAPDLRPFAENGLGAAAFEGSEMVGFLGCFPPFRNAFGLSGVTGVFSPLGANGSIRENRAKIYACLYQAAGEKWVRAGASSHAVCLYAHDRQAQEQFYRYGFGLRCMDAVRGMDEITARPCDGYSFHRLSPEDVPKVLPLEHLLCESYADSPFFMYREKPGEAEFLEEYRGFHSTYFTAEHQGRTVAFIRAELDGETFIQHTPGYLHIKGAYCLEEHRGKGLHQHLLNLLTRDLKAKGYTRLGVDFESFNPSAQGFWQKYFSAYTHGLVRRIDDRAVSGK